MSTAIRVTDLTKRYGSKTVVESVSFEIAQGETFTLLGPNGAGKSTTVETLEGYRTPTSGSVEVLGADPVRAGLQWRSRIGIVAQSLGADTVLTTRELLTHAARVYPVTRDVDEVLSALALTEHADTQVRRLSGGQKRRVDLALGIIGRPEVLFLDEPTTGLDPEVRRQLWLIIRDLAAEGTTVLLTTHYLDEAEALADRAGVIVGGTLVAVDDIDRIGGAEARTPIVRWRQDGRMHEERTSTPTRLVSQLAEPHGEIEGLEVIRPTLESIYLEMLRTHEEDAATAASTVGVVPNPIAKADA